MSVPKESDVVVVGAGPAGLMVAIELARSNRQVTLVEAKAEPARKLLATGGGRCNLTNTLAPSDMAVRFPDHHRFVATVLKAFGPNKLRQWFADLGVETHAPDGFHVFPTTHRAATVRGALVNEIRRLGVPLLSGAEVVGIDRSESFNVVTNGGQTHESQRLVVTCGGVGYPELGDGSGLWTVLASLGHSLSAPLPGMVPVVTRETWVADCRAHTLPKVELTINGTPGRWIGDLIFTHDGLTGPVILDASREIAAVVERDGKAALRLRLQGGQTPSDWPGPPPVDGALSVSVTSTKGLEKAMVTRGGIPPKEVDVRTLQSRVVPGLYLAGEVLDIDGPCGGYNLQWAFASGYRVAKGLS